MNTPLAHHQAFYEEEGVLTGDSYRGVRILFISTLSIVGAGSLGPEAPLVSFGGASDGGGWGGGWGGKTAGEPAGGGIREGMAWQCSWQPSPNPDAPIPPPIPTRMHTHPHPHYYHPHCRRSRL